MLALITGRYHVFDSTGNRLSHQHSFRCTDQRAQRDALSWDAAVRVQLKLFRKPIILLLVRRQHNLPSPEFEITFSSRIGAEFKLPRDFQAVYVYWHSRQLSSSHLKISSTRPPALAGTQDTAFTRIGAVSWGHCVYHRTSAPTAARSARPSAQPD